MANEPREQQETDADRIPDSGTGELDADRLNPHEPLQADPDDDDIDSEDDDAEDDEQPV
jgi:hypothetical protein